MLNKVATAESSPPTWALAIGLMFSCTWRISLSRLKWHHSWTAHVVLFGVASASLQRDPARLFKTHLTNARNQIFHIECSEIFTGEWGGLNRCWSSKEEILIHAGQNSAPPFQFGLHSKRRTQNSFPAHGSRCLAQSLPYCISVWDTQVLLPLPLPHTLTESTRLPKTEE